MINIFYSYKENGPGKVIKNLIAGLAKINVPYSENPDVNSLKEGDMILSLQSHYVMSRNDLTKNMIVGPNICVMPFDNQMVMNQNYITHLVPSEWVKNYFSKYISVDKINVWAVGIDTDKFKDTSTVTKTVDCLLYYKRRNIDDLMYMSNILAKNNQSFEVIEYGSYTEEHFINTINKSKYACLCCGSESQGIAIQEIMSSNLPLFVWDIAEWNDRGSELACPATSVPYWNEQCGIVERDKNKLNESFQHFLSDLLTFTPRELILKELTLEKKAKDLFDLFNSN